ncbi:MAG: NUDIX domain-containing protein [Acetobacteraceae bacterium]|nr:NUDIX domain-containing protein [Acetobacteraceae bacterium]
MPGSCRTGSVFPGGAVDRADHAVRFASPPPARLVAAFGRHAEALAAAAIRETFEETGLRLAGPAPPGSRSPGRGVWAAFRAGGLCCPTPRRWCRLCRLITPTFMAIRFDARFFAAPAEAAQGLLSGGGELSDLRWIPLAEARGRDLALPQKVVLAELSAWLEAGRPERSEAPLWREIGERLVRVPRLAAEAKP